MSNFCKQQILARLTKNWEFGWDTSFVAGTTGRAQIEA